MSSHLIWVGTNCLRQSLTPPLASPGQNVQLWDPLHESEEGCCAFCFSSISSNNGADRVRIMCSRTTKKNCLGTTQRERVSNWLFKNICFSSPLHIQPPMTASVIVLEMLLYIKANAAYIICPLCNEEIPQHVCSGSKPSLCPSNVTKKKGRKKSGKKAKIKCIIHPVSIKPGLRLRIFNNYLCSSINS